MKLYFMKKKAIDYIKANMRSLYINYYREEKNDWIFKLFDYDPFELFMEVPDFQLTYFIDKKGEMDFENCKILFTNLIGISESQASDERLWAGLCHSTFYKFCRDRWDYPVKKLKTIDTDMGVLLSRFFFAGGTRSGLYRNTLSKYWWVGHSVYQEHETNKFELLDYLGPDDLSTKVNDLFYSNTFSSNINITKGICKAWKVFADRGIKLQVREYFRPALQYMNALGGGILLDVLSDEEIKHIFFDYIEELYSKDKPKSLSTVGLYDDIEEEEDVNKEGEKSSEIINMMYSNMERTVEDDNYSNDDDAIIQIGKKEESEFDIKRVNEILGTPDEVMYGCEVIVTTRKDNGEKKYSIPKSNDETFWYGIQKKLLGKKEGDEFFFAGDYYTIKNISW